MRGDNAGGFALMIYWTLACVVSLAIARSRNAETVSIDRDVFLLVMGLGYLVMAVVRTAVIWRIRRRELADDQG